MIIALILIVIVAGIILKFIMSIDDFGESADTMTDEEREEAYKEWNEAWKQTKAKETWGIGGSDEDNKLS